MAENQPLISVIVPVYKVEPYLRKCLDSIVGQTYRNLEIILVDDGSPDRCGEICEEYASKDERIIVFHTENSGLSAARNKGLAEATGEYIGFVDSDDWIEFDMYEVLLRKTLNTNAEVCCCNFWWEKDIGKTKAVEYNSAVFESADIPVALVDGKINVNVWNKLYRAELFHNVRFPEGNNFEDLSIMHKLLENATLVVEIPNLKYHYRDRKNSICRTYSAKNLIDCADAYINRYYYFQDKYPILFSEKEDRLLKDCFRGILRVWSRWYGCKQSEKDVYINEIDEIRKFTRERISKYIRRFPRYMQFSYLFMRKSNTFAFFSLYIMMKIYTTFFAQYQ